MERYETGTLGVCAIEVQGCEAESVQQGGCER